jgi:hypothetical protein
MAMCRLQKGAWDELVLGMITRRLEGKSTLWAWNDGGGSARHLTDCVHHYEGISDLYQAPDNGPMHMVPESWGRGPLDETFYYNEQLSLVLHPLHDYTAIVPANLDWGMGKVCPRTGRQFLGYGRGDNKGVLLTYDHSWKRLAETASFPRTLVVFDDGSVLVGCWAGPVQRILADGTVKDLHFDTPMGRNIPGCFIVDDTANDLVWLLGKEGRPLWAPRHDLSRFEDVKKFKPISEVGGWREVDRLDGDFMALVVHPLTGRAIIMAGTPEHDGRCGFYEVLPGDGGMRCYEVAWRTGMPQWSSNAACAYKKWAAFGSGQVQPGVDGDLVPGIVVGLEKE